MSNVGAQIPTDLTFTGEGAPPASLAGSGRVYFDSTANVFEVSRNNGPFGFQGFAATTLAQNQVVLGQTNGDLATVGSLGATGQCLSSNGSGGPPSWAGCGDVGNADQTNIATAISNTTVFAVPVGSAGRYVINVSLTITTFDTSLATVTPAIGWTNQGISRTVSGTAAAFSSTANSSFLSVPVYADASTNITYSTSLHLSPLTGTYSIHAWVVRQE